MTEIPARASAVIIGAGIVGNSLVHHLALLGWRDLVLVDKGPMPNPGGSTGHASNFIFPIEYSKMMFELTVDSTAQYQELGVFTQSGGIEVARTPERMIELRRRCSQAKSWGIPAEVITPGEVNKLVPYLDESVILGGAHFPTVGVVDSLRAGTLMRESASAPAPSPCWPAPRCSVFPSKVAGSGAFRRPRARLPPTMSSSAAGCGRRGSPGWPGPGWR
jgi:glycine/D-amino acid oxidase-like deaminating enzyme